jgi:hypothetical protein
MSTEDGDVAAVSVNHLTEDGSMQCYSWEILEENVPMLVAQMSGILGPPRESTMTAEGTAEIAEVAVRESVSICADPECEG